jgi:hypothetical protein
MTSDPEPKPEKASKPPRRYWKATEPFIDIRLSHWVQSFLALSLLAVAIVQARVYFTQAGIMRRQLNEMQEERRPWMQGDIQFVGPLVFDQNGARVPIILSLANSGRSPAKNVWRGAKLFAGDGPDDLISGWEDTVCKDIIRDARKGFTIFPNETPGNPFPVGVSALDVKNNVSPDGEIILRIIACVDYTFAFSREHHQTSYIWEIDKSNPATGFTHIKPSDGAIQPNDLLKLTDPSLPGRTT